MDRNIPKFGKIKIYFIYGSILLINASFTAALATYQAPSLAHRPVQTSTAQQSTRQITVSQQSTMLASSESQNFSVSTSKRPGHQNGGQTGVGARSGVIGQIDSTYNDDQFLKMSISPKVEKLPIAVRKSSEFVK
jgi:hypothetical protein